MATKRYRRDFKELELRRRKGMRMLARGVAQAEVARVLEVSRQTTSSWAKRLVEEPQAWRRKPLGRPGGLGASSTTPTSRTVSSNRSAPGKSDATWPSGPTPSTTRSRRGGVPATSHNASDASRAAASALTPAVVIG